MEELVEESGAEVYSSGVEAGGKAYVKWARTASRTAANQVAISISSKARKKYLDISNAEHKKIIRKAIGNIQKNGWGGAYKELKGPWAGHRSVDVKGMGHHYRLIFRNDGSHWTLTNHGPREGVYGSREAATNWRAFADSPIWREHDAVIMTQFRGRERYYEVYTYGEDFGHHSSLAEAKAALERIYGPLPWQRISMPSVEVIHYYFGPTTEFTDPLTVYVTSLPKLGSLVAGYLEQVGPFGFLANALNLTDFEVGDQVIVNHPEMGVPVEAEVTAIVPMSDQVMIRPAGVEQVARVPVEMLTKVATGDELVHLNDRRKGVARCDRQPHENLTEDHREVTCPQCKKASW